MIEYKYEILVYLPVMVDRILNYVVYFPSFLF